MSKKPSGSEKQPGSNNNPPSIEKEYINSSNVFKNYPKTAPIPHHNLSIPPGYPYHASSQWYFKYDLNDLSVLHFIIYTL